MNATYIYAIVLPNSLAIIHNKLELNDWAGQQQTYLYMAAFWSRECGYDLNLLKEQNYYEEPKIQLLKAIEGLEFTHKKAYKSIHLSSKILDIYSGEFNSTSYFENGLHSRIYDILSVYRILCDLYKRNPDAGRAYAAIHRQFRKQIETQCEEVISQIAKASADKIDQILYELLIVILTLLGGMMLIIILGLIPIVSKLRDIFEKEAEFISFIPFEVSK